MKNVFQKMLKRWRLVLTIVVLIAVIFFGRKLFSPHPSIAAQEEIDIPEENDVAWTCSMHPQIREDEPGSCPLCGMDLIPVDIDDLELEERQVTISAAGKALAEISVMPAVRSAVERPVRFFGEIDFDETRLQRVSTDVRGRIESLKVAYTGSRVRKGDPLFMIFSPELISAQEELLQAKRTLRTIESENNTRRVLSAESMAEAVRQKLRWWGVTDQQIDNIEKSGEVIDRFTIKSPVEGVVVERLKDAGDYVEAGEPVYRVADLSNVWVRFEAYESDLPWLLYGQNVTFTAQEALPGEEFEGRIVYIAPVVDRTRRTVKVRANVPNTEGKLKPGMFVRGVVNARLTADGRAAHPPDLRGKWICPLYPEYISDTPGICPISGVELERAEELGYASGDHDHDQQHPLLIPASAPLITGERALVYIQVPDQERLLFEGREITLGPRAGEYYTVLGGLEEGELVVVKGGFKLDSELQLDGRLSMMSPPEEDIAAEPVWDVDEDFLGQLEIVINRYLDIVTALADDDFVRSRDHSVSTIEALDMIDTEALEDHLKDAWNEAARQLEMALHGIHHAEDIEEARIAFEEVSLSLEEVLVQFGVPQGVILYRIHCPMAFDDEGADWFYDEEVVLNPYFGSMMLRCGEVREKLE